MGVTNIWNLNHATNTNNEKTNLQKIKKYNLNWLSLSFILRQAAMANSHFIKFISQQFLRTFKCETCIYIYMTDVKLWHSYITLRFLTYKNLTRLPLFKVFAVNKNPGKWLGTSILLKYHI
jgi:hypothetical protein